jgi:PilZ domain
MDKSKIENRLYVRIKQNAILTCEKYVFPPGTDTTLQASAKNVSSGGLLFESPVVYAIGDTLRIELSLPGWEKCKVEFYKGGDSYSKPLLALASVVRVEALENGRFEIGAKFCALDAGDQMALDKYLNELEKTQN